MYWKHSLIDFSVPFKLHRTIRQIHVHHSAGSELDTPEAVERYAMAREGKGFRCDPYNAHVFRGPDLPIGVNPWLVAWGRDPETIPASAEGDNHGALAVCVHGDWTRAPLPLWGEARLIELLRWWRATVGPVPIYGHRELPGEATECPGFNPEKLRLTLEKVTRGQ